MNPGDKTFLSNLGVPDSTGIARPKTYRFHLDDVNPNTSGRCLCETADNIGPYIIFPGDMLDVSSPRPVLCAGCVPCIQSLLEGEPAPVVELLDPPSIELAPEDVVEDDEVAGL